MYFPSPILSRNCLMKQLRSLILHSNQPCSSLVSSVGDSYLHCIFFSFCVNKHLKKNFSVTVSLCLIFLCSY
jgi:hypothetical protein